MKKWKVGDQGGVESQVKSGLLRGNWAVFSGEIGGWCGDSVHVNHSSGEYVTIPIDRFVIWNSFACDLGVKFGRLQKNS